MMRVMKENKKILLIQLWLGKIPDYFWYHYETTKNINIDFLFITDQEIELKSPNYKVLKITKESISSLLSNSINEYIDIENVRNVTNLKPSLGDLFSDYISDYEFWGYYDIDILFGDTDIFLKNVINDYDVISFGNKNFHNRTCGPFTIIKNTEKNKKLYLNELKTFIYKIKNYEVESFDEHEFNRLLFENNNVKILFDSCNSLPLNGKNLYDSIWSGGKLMINNEEKLLFHFYDKKNTKFEKVGNTIITSHKKHLEEDFYWVTYFTESYEPMIEGLVDSIKKYSNRKCIFYTLNYDSNLRFKLDEQFIFRRIDIEKGDLDRQGRDISVISSKPKILSDSINFIPRGKFIYIDTDIYLTNVCDNLSKYFEILENYPLFNSHIHDKLFANDISENGEWVSTIDILSDETGIPVIIFPRRKTNLIIYDNRSQWFFEEQMSVYYQYKNTRPGIFRLHDEDSANILLSKYDFKKSLPLIDMEESDKIDMNKFESYSYHISNISQNVVLPKSENELYVFHGFKNPKFYEKICENYGKTILDIQDLIIKYENNTITFTKNNFLSDKIMKSIVRFNLFDDKMNLICTLRHQEIFKYWMFFISDIDLKNKILNIEISEEDSNRIIYKNTIKT